MRRSVLRVERVNRGRRTADVAYCEACTDDDTNDGLVEATHALHLGPDHTCRHNAPTVYLCGKCLAELGGLCEDT